MTTFAVHGPAGSGKTTRLLVLLEERVRSQPLGTDQRILALTFMHGSRVRLTERLSRLTLLNRRFDCQTIDSFAWALVRRWRTKLAERATSGDGDYDETCRAAGHLLEAEEVCRWVARRYPIVLVDELQDCNDGRLAIVQRLAKATCSFFAGDGFQDLRSCEHNAAMEWLTALSGAEELTQIHRTQVSGLLAAARALREGATVVGGTRFKILQAKNPNVGASFLAKNLTWWAAEDTAILSGTGDGTSPFVSKAIDRLAQKPFDKDGQRFGPFKLSWEQSPEILGRRLREAVGIPEESESDIAATNLRLDTDLPGARTFRDWIARERRVSGVSTFRCDDLHLQVSRALSHLRFTKLRSKGPRLMTIHQAKNREFDKVVVLWPVGVGGTLETHRRLLYNAITRARQEAVVVVQDPDGTRLRAPPFAYPAAGPPQRQAPVQHVLAFGDTGRERS